jgi:hypothetical protein
MQPRPIPPNWQYRPCEYICTSKHGNAYIHSGKDDDYCQFTNYHGVSFLQKYFIKGLTLGGVKG